MRIAFACAVGLGLVACNTTKAPTETAEAAAIAHPDASPQASAALDASATAPASTRAIETWTGTYVSAPAAVFVYDASAYAGVSWRGDDAGSGLGEGPLSITLDRASGTVRGTASGPLGDATLTGALSGDSVTASVARKDPTDRGFTGTMVATIKGDKLEGTMHLSVANARIVREATLHLARQKP